MKNELNLFDDGCDHASDRQASSLPSLQPQGWCSPSGSLSLYPTPLSTSFPATTLAQGHREPLHELCARSPHSEPPSIPLPKEFFLIKCKFHCVTSLFKDSSVDSHSSQDRVQSNPLPWHKMIFAVCISINFHSPLMAWFLRNPSTPNLLPFTWRFPNLSCILAFPCLNFCWRGPEAACPSLRS